MKKNLSSHKTKYVLAIGRRKTATARVRLFKGEGKNLVNGVENNLPVLESPLRITDTNGKYYFSAKVTGGGKKSQIDAIILGISRALNIVGKDKYRPILKKANFLTRDAREKLRRMVGTGGKARRQKQSPKR